MILECCAQERSYMKFFGLLAQRFCEINKEYQDKFVVVFAEQVTEFLIISFRTHLL